jgi:hypothetical protein
MDLGRELGSDGCVILAGDCNVFQSAGEAFRLRNEGPHRQSGPSAQAPTRRPRWHAGRK